MPLAVCLRGALPACRLAALAHPCLLLPPTLPPPQTDINDKMRAILIDWLVDVHLKFKVRGWMVGRSSWQMPAALSLHLHGQLAPLPNSSCHWCHAPSSPRPPLCPTPARSSCPRRCT